jgi:cyclopropane fatty-acyl-phospholipid synthase-like methyltransferase
MGSFVTYVPTPFEHIGPFFALAPVSSNDVVYDLGSGDGRLLFSALEKGAGKAVGVELNPEHVNTARVKAKEQGLEDKATFIQSDVMDVDLSWATVIFCYLITAASAALKPKFEAELKPGTRVVMESFPVPGWKPEKTMLHEYKTFFLYRMPPEIDEKYIPGVASTDNPDYTFYF